MKSLAKRDEKWLTPTQKSLSLVPFLGPLFYLFALVASNKGTSREVRRMVFLNSITTLATSLFLFLFGMVPLSRGFLVGGIGLLLESILLPVDEPPNGC